MRQYKRRLLALLCLLTFCVLGAQGPCGAVRVECVQIGDSTTICGLPCTEDSVNIVLTGDGQCVDLGE